MSGEGSTIRETSSPLSIATAVGDAENEKSAEKETPDAVVPIQMKGMDEKPCSNVAKDTTAPVIDPCTESKDSLEGKTESNIEGVLPLEKELQPVNSPSMDVVEKEESSKSPALDKVELEKVSNNASLENPNLEENLEAESLVKVPKSNKPDLEETLETNVKSPILNTPELEEILETKSPVKSSLARPDSEEDTKSLAIDTPDIPKIPSATVKSPQLETPDVLTQDESTTNPSSEIPEKQFEISEKKSEDVVSKEHTESLKEHSVDGKTTEDVVGEDKVLHESMEIMDTCDSQESTNLVIDETSNVMDNKDENESQSDTDMVVVEDKPIEEADSNKKMKKTLTLEGTIVEFDEENQTGLDKATEAVDDCAMIDEEEKTTSINKKDETHPSEEIKDDDVITIEQPPMPVIEIDDEDEEEPTLAVVEQSKPEDKEKDEEKPMEIDEEPLSETTESGLNKKALVEESTDDLLTVVKEKSMDEVMEDSKSKDSEDLAEEDTTDEVFYNKECINYECPHKHKQFFRVPQFAFSYFKVNKKKFKIQYICAECYDKALDMYEEYCGLISAKQPLLLENIPSGRQEFVEIIDSSDEEDASDTSKAIEPTKSAFSKNDLSLIERELHNTIRSVLSRVEIQNQLTWSKTILSERLKRLEMETEFVDNELKSLQKKADKMHEGLYSCPKIKIRQLHPLDLNSGKVMGLEGPQAELQPIPPVGEIERPPIQVNGSYYAVKNNAIASWVPCKVMEQTEGGAIAQKNVKYYRIKFLKSQNTMLKTVPAKYLAYYDPPIVRLPIGTRVIAYFDATSLARGREKINVQSAFYPGIIAEPLKPNNKFRYLIFYDDGYTQYVYHKDVRLVCLVSENVWEDVHPASRDFIQKYLTQYSINRPMVQTQKGQSMNTESNGYWLHARVVDIDCSLVLMQFEGSKSHTEWIYRGSLRLGPVFKEYQKTLQKNSNMPVSRLSRRTEPFIRYTEDEESSSQQQQQQQQQQSDKTSEANRAVARKSFGRPESMMNTSSAQQLQQQQQQQQQPPTVKHLNNSTIYVEDENKPKGKVVYYTAKRNNPPRKYTPHKCSKSCLSEITHNLNAYSPLAKPLLSGWERFIIRQKIKKVVTYRGPCGKIMRNMKELHHYLRVTKNALNVDNFDFSHDTNCLAEYVIESVIVQKRDISLGQEKMAIPLVNYYDNTLPPECKYSAKVIPTEGVHINTDPEFFAGCDCEDDCSDKSKCSCWQLTLAGAKYGNPNTPPEEVGYQYKRLLEHVPTGIYECNVRCKCKQNCLNRVVQHSLQIKLQVFKTSNRGWGLRCINDVPRGSFVCVYAGHLLTEAKANEGGQDAGDEYFAELDYIEVAEQIKEGYESEVEPPEPEDEDAYQPELDDEFTPSKSFLTRSKKQNSTKSTRQDDDSQERQVINFNPNADMNEDSVRENSIRKLYGKDEACYVMDAKISGNLGRYFNHSCAPNMFVQNVFVDTHDLRFPWVAFFSSCNIRAGTELTWNYNYEVGVVPGKVLYCQCGAPTCRLRLL